MDVARNLLSKVIASGDINAVVAAGVTREFFPGAQDRQVFDVIIKHKQRYGNVPGITLMQRDFPEYKFIEAEESIEFLVEELQRLHKLAVLERGLGVSVELYDQQRDPDKVLEEIHKTLRKIATDVPVGRDTNLTETGTERLARYMALRDLPDGLRGIATGFHTIDVATQGLQNQQLVTFVGPPKAGKSTLMLLASMAAHVQGYRPLFVGFEMSNQEQEERFDAIRAGISHTRLRGGQLSKEETIKLERSLRQLEAMPDFWLSSDTMSATTLSGVQAKIETLRPDVVFVDGVYMMDDELGEAKGSPQALTNITRGFKRMAQNMDLPICISTQALEWKMDRKRGLTSGSIGYSSSFAQDSDVVFGVERYQSDDPADNNKQRIKVLLSRNCPPLETLVLWDWEKGSFKEIEDEDPQEGDY